MNDTTDDDDTADLPIVRDFDKVCFEFGDRDAIWTHASEPVSYFELQEHSKALAYQLYHRFGWPDYVLVDCQDSPAAEAVATLSCMRIRRPFVPVSSLDQHRPGRMNAVVDLLSARGKRYSCREYDHCKEKGGPSTSCPHPPSIVAVVVCENDRDPILSVFQQAGVHQILYLDPTGGIRECLSVPEEIRLKDIRQSSSHDDMYIMFTSGTSTVGGSVSAKAVIGSHRATHARLRWFLDTFSSSPRIGRRTKLTFVDGVTELWGGLLDPMNILVSVPPIQLRERGVISLVEDMECTQLLLLPSQANQLLLASSETNSLSNLDRIIVSGEVCSPVLLEQFLIRYPKIQLINLYGQTETTGDCLCAVLSELGEDAVVNNVVAVGKPIVAGIQVSPLDKVEDDSDSADDKQIVIKGSLLSNGYLGSLSSFHQFLPGDLGFCRNGQWYIRGRVDDVRKINGVLTSLVEIESAFCKIYNVSDCAGVVAVMVDNKTHLLCTSKDAVDRFSRLHMHEEGGIPLNLIPNRVFQVQSIPRSASGAKKIDRKACTKLVQTHNLTKESSILCNSNGGPKRKADRKVSSIVAEVLGIDENHLDGNKSFIELGGDSASSITLLYRLKREVNDNENFTATDILWCESMDQLENMVMGVTEKPKRPKREDQHSSSRAKKFVPQPLQAAHSWHRSISLMACVDSTPVVIGDSVISACHGGTIMRYNITTGVIEGYRHYPDWMFQADMKVLEGTNTVLVCGYSLSNKGVVICLTCDLKTEEWKTELADPIKNRPVRTSEECWVLSGPTLVGIDIRNGQLLNRDLKLPRSPCVSNPIVVQKDGQEFIAFASSDWEGGIMLVDVQKLTSGIYIDCEIGPVHKGMAVSKDSEEMYISDIYGSLHVLNLKTMQLTASIQLSVNPLTAPAVVEGNKIIAGSYNGKLYCVGYEEESGQLEKQWERDCYSSLRSKPLNFGNGSTVVCTTAGSFFRICEDTGEMHSFGRIPAEIWSSPVQIGQRSNLFAVGARDSRSHLLSV